MPLPTPIRGQDILPWATAVTDICRRVGGVGASRLLVREGPGGVGFDALPENKRDKAAASADAYPWKVTYAGSGEDGSFAIYLPNLGSYYDVNGTTNNAVSRVISELDRHEKLNNPWRKLDVKASGTVYLLIEKNSTGYIAKIETPDKEDEENPQEGDNEENPQEGDNEENPQEGDDDEEENETFARLPIAEITITTRGDKTTRTILQYVCGEIILASPGACYYT